MLNKNSPDNKSLFQVFKILMTAVMVLVFFNYPLELNNTQAYFFDKASDSISFEIVGTPKPVVIPAPPKTPEQPKADGDKGNPSGGNADNNNGNPPGGDGDNNNGNPLGGDGDNNNGNPPGGDGDNNNDDPPGGDGNNNNDDNPPSEDGGNNSDNPPGGGEDDSNGNLSEPENI